MMMMFLVYNDARPNGHGLEQTIEGKEEQVQGPRTNCLLTHTHCVL